MKNEIDIDKKTLANLSSMVDGKTIATDDFLALLRNPAAMEELNARLRLRNILGPVSEPFSIISTGDEYV